MLDKNFGFTLAEVLITLGIIGVVAAMTMPALMAKYQKQVTVNKLKKAYSEIAQAVQLSEVEHGTVDSWDFVSMPGETNGEKQNYFLENYIIKNLKVTKNCKNGEYAKCNFTKVEELNGEVSALGAIKGRYLITASGYGILLHPGGGFAGENYAAHVHMQVDLDGPTKGENKLGKDNFIITLYMAGPWRSRVSIYGTGGGLSSREDLLNDEEFGCNTGANGWLCGALIVQDGWEIKDDYPW